MKWIFLALVVSCTTPAPVSVLPFFHTAHTEWKDNAPRCDGYVSKEDCDDGDTTLFAGLLCLAGVPDGCITVMDSQDYSGRWWRSPRRSPGNLGRHNSFSRDMSLGVLAYLIATKDQQAAINWMNWIEGNRPCLMKFFGQCKFRGLHRLCKDDNDHRCTITPNVFQLMYYTWKHIGLSPTKTMAMYKDTPLLFPGSKGYEIHLYGVSEFLRQKMNKGKPESVKILIEKQPNNPFYMYLNTGKTQEVVDRYKNLCPETFDHAQSQWSWERVEDERAWENSMLWDCVFMDAL